MERHNLFVINLLESRLGDTLDRSRGEELAKYNYGQALAENDSAHNDHAISAISLLPVAYALNLKST